MISLHFQITKADTPYINLLKPILSGKAKVSLANKEPDTILEVIMTAREKGSMRFIATTSEKLLALLVPSKNKPSINDHAGSIIERHGYEFLILDPLKQLVTVPHGRHIYERSFSKFLKPASWMSVPEFAWELFEPKRAEHLLEVFATADLIAADIETVRDDADRVIDCIAFTAVHFIHLSHSYRLTTVTIPFTDDFNITFAKAILWLSVPKVFQNGKYDHAYLLRYGLASYNWAFDTINMFHSWYSELPKDLAFITSYLVRKWEFWKDESGTNKYMYNAKDSFVTAVTCLALLREMPTWALNNFIMEFPLVFPCVMAELRGIKCDEQRMSELGVQLTGVYEEKRRRLGIMVANPDFNPGSWQQTLRLFTALGSGDVRSTDKSDADKVASRHPLNKRILGDIKTYRENKKLDSSYIKPECLWHGRFFFALNPHGTDTSRLASRESQYWCGVQIQNIPRDRSDIKIKDMFVADSNFAFGEADYEQNEARGTGYLSGDVNLISAVDDESRDFHGTNAARFFGVPYESIVKSYIPENSNTGEWIHDTIDKALRDLSKRTNHGSNYNMGPGVLLDTMGIENVLRAKRLLKLPQHWTLLKVCEYLLECYVKAYPVVKGAWYDKVKGDVASTSMLIGPTGWTRFCFGNPNKSKRDLNRYVAHPPQSLAAQVLNKAYMNTFYNVQLPNPDDFKLGPQIHDSILFQYRIGMEHLAYAVKKAMEVSVKVTDSFGITRTLLVPVALKGGAYRWSEVHKI